MTQNKCPKTDHPPQPTQTPAISFDLIRSRNSSLLSLKSEYFSTCLKFLQQFWSTRPQGNSGDGLREGLGEGLGDEVGRRVREIREELWIFGVVTEREFLGGVLWDRYFRKNRYIRSNVSLVQQFTLQKQYIKTKLQQWNGLSQLYQFVSTLSQGQEVTGLVPYDRSNVLSFMRTQMMSNPRKVFCGSHKWQYKGAKSDQVPLHTYLNFPITCFQPQSPTFLQTLQTITQSILLLRLLQLTTTSSPSPTSPITSSPTTIKSQSQLSTPNALKLDNSRQIILFLDFVNLKVDKKLSYMEIFQKYFADVFGRYVMRGISALWNVKFQIYGCLEEQEEQQKKEGEGVHNYEMEEQVEEEQEQEQEQEDNDFDRRSAITSTSSHSIDIQQQRQHMNAEISEQ